MGQKIPFVGSSHTAGQQIEKQSSSAFGGFHCNVCGCYFNHDDIS